MSPIIVSEMTTNHLGNLNVALEMVRRSAEAGADFVKFQKKDVSTFYSEEKLRNPYDSPYGHTYWDYRKIFEFDEEDFIRIDQVCKDVGIQWFATAQDVASAEFLVSFDMPMIKVASCNTSEKELHRRIRDLFTCPVVVSVGGTDLDTIDYVVSYFNDRPLYIQQCTSTYPCPNDQLYLGNIVEMRKRYAQDTHVKIGYSGHEIGYIPTLIAVSQGAEIIERHFCLSRKSFAHHIECSLEPDEFKGMVQQIRGIPDMMRSGFGIKSCEELFLRQGVYGGTDQLQGGSEIK